MFMELAYLYLLGKIIKWLKSCFLMIKICKDVYALKLFDGFVTKSKNMQKK